MTRTRCRVVKFGGSLLRQRWTWPRLGAWLLRDATEHQVLVMGGGEWADGVRQLDAAGRCSAAQAHWLAVRAMSLTAWTFGCLHPEFVHVDRWRHLEQVLTIASRPALFLFDVADWLQDEERQRSAGRLPLGWQVTSDSIAAHLAHRLRAEELLLLKSVSGSAGRVSAEEPSLVDAYFPTAASGLRRVRVVNLAEVLGGT